MRGDAMGDNASFWSMFPIPKFCHFFSAVFSLFLSSKVRTCTHKLIYPSLMHTEPPCRYAIFACNTHAHRYIHKETNTVHRTGSCVARRSLCCP